uniref:Uncharacterized protein n=1 Tax=Aceria tosichella TaxID=561515 RepID=A0A6G1SDH8_9ACAR
MMRLNCIVFALSTFIFIVTLNYKSFSSARISGGTARQSRETSDSCHLRELELCAMGVMSIFQNPNGLPMSQIDMTRQCEYLNESVQCFDDYSHRCLSANQARIANMFTGNVIQLARDFCRDDSELRRNYTKHVSCFREVQRDHQRHCMTDFQVGFEGIHKMATAKRLPLACCNLGRLKECIFVPIDNECGVTASATIESLLEAVFGGLYQFPCRTYNSSNPECSELLPKINSKPHHGRNISALSRVVSSFTNVPAQM